jgi:hypothetical protein
MACGALRHAADDLTGHGGMGQFTVLWVFAIMACGRAEARDSRLDVVSWRLCHNGMRRTEGRSRRADMRRAEARGRSIVALAGCLA